MRCEGNIQVMEIPYKELATETLRAIIEDFVSREGTDYGHEDFSFETKISQVMKSLEVGKAIVTFDAESETCSISTKDDGGF
ncbi:MAG TPA: cytoplasmic protein [Gammaproteobacteria bacterium]|nr:cytoplasmic protein [Gammaproteobacteria bacterium]